MLLLSKAEDTELIKKETIFCCWFLMFNFYLILINWQNITEVKVPSSSGMAVLLTMNFK